MTQSVGRNVTASVDDSGNGLFLEFVHQGDRYGHRVGILAGGVPRETLLTSIEGEEGAADALRVPALQELSVSALPDGRSASALVGMSDARHWSLTVEDDPAADRPGLILDYACRARHEPVEVGNRYAIAPEVDVAPLDSGVLLTAASRQVRLGVSAMMGWPKTEVGVSRQELQVVCSTSDADAQLVTVRWRYVVECMDAGDVA